MFLLPMDSLSADEILGHAMEVSGRIGHDEERANSIRNSMCRAYLREAEAFTAGYQLGKKENENE